MRPETRSVYFQQGIALLSRARNYIASYINKVKTRALVPRGASHFAAVTPATANWNSPPDDTCITLFKLIVNLDLQLVSTFKFPFTKCLQTFLKNPKSNQIPYLQIK